MEQPEKKQAKIREEAVEEIMHNGRYNANSLIFLAVVSLGASIFFFAKSYFVEILFTSIFVLKSIFFLILAFILFFIGYCGKILLSIKYGKELREREIS